MSNAPTASAANLSLVAIRFMPAPPPGCEILGRFQQPAPVVAVSTALATGPSLATPAVPADGFLLLTVSPGDPAGQQQAQAWLPSDPAPEPALRQAVEGGWVLYRPGRVVLCAAEAAARELRVALADVQFHDGHLRQLEADIARDWPTAQAHIPLAHQADLKRSRSLKALTEDTLTRRLCCARLERPLLAPATPMSEAARKLALKLRDALEIEDRLETLDGQLEVYEDLCEQANQRQTDYSHFLRGFIVEIAIVLLLTAEAVLMLMTYFSE